MRRHRPQRNWGARVHESTHYGIDAVVLENTTLRVTVLAGKGTDIVELNYKPLDLDFAPISPGGVRVPRNDQGDAFMDHYPGGWQEVLPNGGVPTGHAGATYGQHGEVSLVPWDHWIERDDPAGVTVAFEIALRTVPLRLTKRLSLDRTTASLRFQETLVNESDVEVDAMWGHHIAFGPPFLTSDTRLETAVEAPALGQGSSIDYLTGLDVYTIRDDRIGLRVTWDARTMPYLWVWQERGATRSYPWWGRLRTIGLEPFSSYPTDGLAEAVRNDTALRLAPREARDFDLTATVLEGTHATDHR
jgi:hypothetical protein